MQILAASKYPTPRNGPLSLEDTETRRLAYAGADREPRESRHGCRTSDLRLFEHSSPHFDRTFGNGNTRVASSTAGAPKSKFLSLTQLIQSQCTRHKHALGPIPPAQHHLARTRKPLTLRQTYFVDNVTTSGHTLEAARTALGFGTGLVFADAAPRRVQIQATLF